MSLFDIVYDRFSAATPILREYVNGEVVERSDDSRVEFLTASVTNYIDKCWNDLRSNRNSLLVASDWTQVADAPVDAIAWADYRQALRDLPANTTDPENPVWPEPPTT